MNLVLHIFKKDIRHLRGLLATWLLLVLLQAGLSGSGLASLSDNMAWQITFSLLAVLIPMLQSLLIFAIVPLLIQDEPLVGTTAFWATRPVSRNILLRSKALYCGGLLVLLPLLIELAVLAANRASLSQLALAVPEILLNRLGTLLMVAALAVLTPTYARFIFVAVLGFVGYMLIQFALHIAMLFMDPMALVESRQNMSLVASQQIVTGLFTALGFSAVVIHQYLFRRTLRSVLLLGLAIAGMLALPLAWKWDFMAPSPPAGSSAEFDPGHIDAVLERHTLDVSDHFRMSSREGRRKQIRGRIRVSGDVPGHEFHPQVSRATFTFSDGFQATNARTSYALFSRDWDRASLSHALEGRIIVGNASLIHSSSDLFTMEEADFNAHADQTGDLDATITVHIFRYDVTGAIPLKPNHKIDLGAEQAVITDVLEDPAGCSVILRERTLRLMFDRSASGKDPFGSSSVLYVLRNPARREIALPADDFGGSFDLASAGRQRLTVRSVRLKYGEDRRDQITPEWLADAELVRVEAVRIGQADKTLQETGLRLESRFRGRSAGMKTEEQVSEDLNRIQWPEHPAPEDVREYIQAIDRASSGQQRWGSDDRQVAMLKKIGSEHALLLAETTPDSYYLRFALPALITDEHQTWVMDHLRAYPWLAEVVWKNGWAEAARPVLLRGLKERWDDLPQAWIKAVASFEDPATYQDLVNYFVNGDNREATYRLLRKLPGIDLDDAVSQAWKNAKYEPDFKTRDLLPVAIAHGHIDALRIGILDMPDSSFGDDSIRKTIREHTGLDLPDDEIQDWFRENEKKLRFENTTRLYRVQDADE